MSTHAMSRHETRETAMEPTTLPCACDACLRLRAARRAPRLVPYGDGMRPAWHVPLTPEHAELKDALSAVAYAHPREAQWLGSAELRTEWDRLVAVEVRS